MSKRRLSVAALVASAALASAQDPIPLTSLGFTEESQFGLSYLATARDEGRELTGVAGRSLRALENSVVAMAMFAPAVLVLHALGISTGATLLAAQAFLVARVLYLAVYLAGIPWLRTLIWAVGALATLYLYFAAL